MEWSFPPNKTENTRGADIAISARAWSCAIQVKCKGNELMKFDCVKVSGKLDFVHLVSPIKNGYLATISLGGVAIPNAMLPSALYEELDAGENVTIYGMFKDLKKKEKNDGIIYGIQKADGEKMFAFQYRYTVPMMMAFYAALAFCVVFVAGWAASCIPVAYFVGLDSPQIFIYQTTVVACLEGGLAAAFFIWRAWLLIKVTHNPDEWKLIEPAALSTRFSKLHK
jgi:hypothetical protein